MLKTTYNEEYSVHANSESCNIQLGSLKNQFNSKQIIQILQLIIIDNISTHSYIVDISYFFMIRKLLLKTFIPVSRIFNNEDDIFIFSWILRKSSTSREIKLPLYSWKYFHLNHVYLLFLWIIGKIVIQLHHALNFWSFYLCNMSWKL